MELLIANGSEIKTVKENVVAGYLVLFSDKDSPDLDGDFFTKETDFDLLESGAKRGVYYNHGLDGQIKKRRLGVGEIKLDDVGLWIEAQLDIRDEYERAILELAKQGKLGWSSGAAPHLVERIEFAKSAFIKKWVIAEASLTPTPAEPRSKVVNVIKTNSSGLTLEGQTEETVELLKVLTKRFEERKRSREQSGRTLSEKQKNALWEIMVDIKSLIGDYEPQEVFNSKLKDELNKLEAEFLFKKINKEA